MRTAIITVAGVSSRFNHGFSDQVLKSIYYEEDEKKALLYHQCQQCQEMDKIIIVGGYQYSHLLQYIEHVIPGRIRGNIVTVYNQNYGKYASGYSLFLGLQEALSKYREGVSEILFMEGDLAFDMDSLNDLLAIEHNVLASTWELIDARKSVVVYEDVHGRYKYAFNEVHGMLHIHEPFYRIWNSAQVWKLTDMKCLEDACDFFLRKAIDGTSLKIIQNYFDRIEKEKISVIPFRFWVNCNTRQDWSYLNKCNFWDEVI